MGINKFASLSLSPIASPSPILKATKQEAFLLCDINWTRTLRLLGPPAVNRESGSIEQGGRA